MRIRISGFLDLKGIEIEMDWNCIGVFILFWNQNRNALDYNKLLKSN